MPFWNTNSTTLDNKVMYVNNTYKDASGKNKLSTITTTNTTGYRDVLEGSTAKIGDKPPGLKGLSYAVQNDGKITYKYDDGTGNIKQYNSIQEFANSSIVGYDANTTKRIKDAMQKNLTSQVNSYNEANPSSKIGPAKGADTESGTAAKGSIGGGAVDAKGKTRTFGNFTYPEDLGSTKQDIVKFTMLEYKPSGFGALGSSGGSETLALGGGRGSDFKDRKILGSVVLPIPSGISDTNAASWGENSMNALQAALAAGAYKGITEGIGAGLGSLGASAENAVQDPNTKKAVASAFTAAAIGGDNQAILARAEGIVINPNMELLFNGPSLRPFSFTFKMSARSSTEAKQIISILNFFKRGMSPIKSESNLFLKTPNTFRIQYIHRPKGEDYDHPYIGKIKECALQSITVNYTPEGQYATFHDGVLVSYEMQMQFQELEPVFNSDYEGLEGIGY